MYRQYELDVQHAPYARFIVYALRFFTTAQLLLRVRFGRISLFSGRKESSMLWTIFIMLLILWLLGLVSSYTLGGYIHLLLVVAVIVLVVNLLTGRRGAI